jgi:hypothetical protein
MATIKLRRGTAAEWAAQNPVLAQGEPGWERDTKKLKLGDGSTARFHISTPPSPMPRSSSASRMRSPTCSSRAPTSTSSTTTLPAR